VVNRPLEPVYPVVLIDAIQVKIRDGQVTNRPIYVAVGVTCAGERDILGLEFRVRRPVFISPVSLIVKSRVVWS
jgi:transposase-like protein